MGNAPSSETLRGASTAKLADMLVKEHPAFVPYAQVSVEESSLLAERLQKWKSRVILFSPGSFFLMAACPLIHHSLCFAF